MQREREREREREFTLYCEAQFPTVVIQIASHHSLVYDMLDKSCLHAHTHTSERSVSQEMWASGFSLATVNSGSSKTNGEGRAGMWF